VVSEKGKKGEKKKVVKKVALLSQQGGRRLRGGTPGRKEARLVVSLREEKGEAWAAGDSFRRDRNHARMRRRKRGSRQGGVGGGGAGGRKAVNKRDGEKNSPAASLLRETLQSP